MRVAMLVSAILLALAGGMTPLASNARESCERVVVLNDEKLKLGQENLARGQEEILRQLGEVEQVCRRANEGGNGGDVSSYYVNLRDDIKALPTIGAFEAVASNIVEKQRGEMRNLWWLLVTTDILLLILIGVVLMLVIAPGRRERREPQERETHE